MADTDKVFPDLIRTVLDEYSSKMNLNSASKILVSDANIAQILHDQTKNVRTPYGPTVTLATNGSPGDETAKVKDIANVRAADDLEFETYSHAFWAFASEDPKFVFQGLKYMITAMQPKGIAIVISLKVEAGQADGEEGQFNVGLEDKMTYQSKGKIQKLTEAMEYVGFERGKIRSIDRSSEAGGKKVDAEVVLAMKWDQLTG